VCGDAISSVGTWYDGAAPAADAPSWDAVAAGFLGCGYRVPFPYRPGFVTPLDHAEEQAQRVADTFGARCDGSAWEALRGLLARRGPGWTGVRVVGGWSYGLDRSFGPPWTRAHTGLAVRAGVPVIRAITLPWVRDTRSPTASLPMISGLADAQASALLASRGADVGLWTDRAGEVVTTTAGALLLWRDGRWAAPRADVGAGASWPWVVLRDVLSAQHARVTHAELLASRCVAFVSPLGNLGVAAALDDQPLVVDESRRDELAAAQGHLLPEHSS